MHGQRQKCPCGFAYNHKWGFFLYFFIQFLVIYRMEMCLWMCCQWKDLKVQCWEWQSPQWRYHRSCWSYMRWALNNIWHVRANPGPMLLLASSPQVSFTESPGASTLSSWSWQLPPSVSRSCSFTYVNQRGRWCGVNTKYLPAVCVLAGGATTSQVQIWNNTSRELSFDLSWPAHCLTITPQHGVIDPQSVHNPLTSVLYKLYIGCSFFFLKKMGFCVFKGAICRFW